MSRYLSKPNPAHLCLAQCSVAEPCHKVCVMNLDSKLPDTTIMKSFHMHRASSTIWCLSECSWARITCCKDKNACQCHTQSTSLCSHMTKIVLAETEYWEMYVVQCSSLPGAADRLRQCCQVHAPAAQSHHIVQLTNSNCA